MSLLKFNEYFKYRSVFNNYKELTTYLVVGFL
ncbi:hypothetical protein HNQ06_001049 [Borrelia lanei]|uniref:Uncharacterized protein n=1 Tax=Borreliella lanei TaxID=373540 RepID=A0A7X0DKV6_9SPIR|nr:hypothetical protein [Borreliella lanei]